MGSGSRSSTGSGPPEDASDWRTRGRRWLLSYGLHVETLLTLVLLVLAAVTVVVVFVGAITALPTGPPPEEGGSVAGGSGDVLGFGTLLINGILLLAIGLGVFVLVHGAVEVWSVLGTDSGSDVGDGVALAYAMIRAVQTVAALAFVGPILAGVSLSRFGVIGDAPPNALLVALLFSGLVLLGSVLVHATGRVTRSLLDA